jgi:hypothetical protein
VQKTAIALILEVLIILIALVIALGPLQTFPKVTNIIALLPCWE